MIGRRIAPRYSASCRGLEMLVLGCFRPLIFNWAPVGLLWKAPTTELSQVNVRVSGVYTDPIRRPKVHKTRGLTIYIPELK